MKKYFLFLFVLFSILYIYPQQSGGWKIYTSLKDVKDFTFYENSIWAATSGGAFRYSLTDSTFTRYNKVNGFLGIKFTAVCNDNFGNIWFGSINGSIDYIANNAQNAVSIPDIYNSDKINKQINSFELSGDSIIVAHDFGISIIDTREKILKDTYFKLGSLATNTTVHYAVKYDRIYAANNNGVIVQKFGATNLSAPESWDIYTTANGLLSNNVAKVQLFNGNIVAATDEGLSVFNGQTWSSLTPELELQNVSDIYTRNDSLYIIVNNAKLFVYANNSLTWLYNYPAYISKVKVNGSIYAATTEGIIKNIYDQNLVYILPNGPKANQFVDLTVDKSGTLWVASGSDRTGIGYFSMKDEVWTNYNTANTPTLPTNAYFTNYTAPDNSVYFGSWGQGFLRVKDNLPSVFSKSVTGMQGFSLNPDFLVVTSFATDSKNNLWVMNFGAVNKKILTMFSPTDSTFRHFSIPAFGNQYYQEFFNLVIDPYDTKWFSVNDANRKGLVYFNENNTPDNPNDDISGTVQFNDISSVIVDKRGDIWVGTSLGVYILSNIQSIFSNSPSVGTQSIFTLRQQTVNCMLVDPLNQKWIGTNEGLLLVNSDGTSLLAAYDTKNSPLLSNIIRSLAIDENTGRMYVGTDDGIISFETSSIEPKESFSGIFVYPSPFKLNGTDRKVTIDGLIRDTDIKILNISGKLIREFSSPGGRVAYWDGKDDNGREVSSGIYIIVAFDKEGNSVATGKIAVLKE